MSTSVTRKEALLLGLKFYIGKQCKRGHISLRYVSTKQCIACHKEASIKVSSEIIQARNRKYYVENVEASLKYQKEYFKKNKEKIYARNNIWSKENSVTVNKLHSAWRKANLDIVSAESARKRALKLERLPGWVDLKAIRNIYKEAKLKSEKSGIKYVVDHFYPLKGDTISGLHTPENLRIITWVENSIKSNSMPKEE